MRQNPQFVLCDVAGNHVLMPVGSAAIDLNGMLSLNDTGVVIWEKLKSDMAFDELLTAILEEYNVSEEVARADLTRYLKTMRDVNAIVD